MSELVINIKNKDKINKWFDSYQKKCTVRKMDYDKLIYATDVIESKLDIPKCHLKGTVARIDLHAQKFPNCYKGIPESTVCEVKYCGSYWKLTHVYRTKCGTINRFSIGLSESAKDALMSRMTNF